MIKLYPYLNGMESDANVEEETGGEMMAEYSEVIKQFKRMCKSVTPAKCTRGECPMGCENIGQCRKVAFERPAKFEEQVMSWAAEHPEPEYPTWEEWLVNQGVFERFACRYGIEYQYRLNGRVLENIPTEKLFEHIPDDIAQKLGIEPKK